MSGLTVIHNCSDRRPRVQSAFTKCVYVGGVKLFRRASRRGSMVGLAVKIFDNR